MSRRSSRRRRVRRRRRNALRRQQDRERWANGGGSRERGSVFVARTRRGSYEIRFKFSGLWVPFSEERPTGSLREAHQAMARLSQATETAES